MSKKRFFELITKSQSENLNKNEEKELAKLISSNPEFLNEADFVTTFWEEQEFSVQANGEHVFSEISKNINENDIIPLRQERKASFKTRFLVSKVAAMIMFFLLAGFLAVWIVGTDNSNDIKQLAEQLPGMVEKHIPSGQKLRIFLPDGSIVWLNSESTLMYPEAFEGNTRVVKLHGEAFFEVVRNPEMPFVVKSGNVSTTALGTSFNVRSYSFEDNIEVALETGKVLVEIEKQLDQKFVLDPGFAVSYAKDKSTVQKRGIEIENIVAWKDGVLRFERDDLETVFGKLSRWYGVEFKISESLAGEVWKYSGWFKNDYLDNVLESISFAQDFQYKIDNKKVLITKKN